LCRAATLGVAWLGCTAPAIASGDDFQVSPSLSLQQVYNSTSQGPGGGSSDLLVSAISTGIHVTGDTPHATLDFSYSPSFNHYELGNVQDHIEQNELSSSLITPFPNLLTIKVDTYAVEMGAKSNSLSGLGGTLPQSDDRMLYYIGSVTPRLTRRFGDVATLDAFFRLNSVNTSDESTHVNGGRSASGDSLQQEAQATIGSGDSFGRLSASLNLDHGEGSASAQGSAGNSSDSDYVGLEYHLNHAFSLTGSIGYQKTFYGATLETPSYTSAGMTWNAGVRYTPNPLTLLSISYGLQQGVYVPTLQLNYALGERTTLTASYITKVTTQLETLANNLQFLTYNAAGQPIDSRTGLPYVGITTIFGSQNALFRDKPLVIAINHELERSGVTAIFTYEVRSSVTGATARDVAYGGSLSYFRELTPLLKCDIDFEFTDHTSSGAVQFGAEHAQLINANFWFEYKLSETATARLAGAYLQRTSNITANDSTTTQVTLGLRKDF
jgi:uncharacterized protein (PEP-CTERM system associated)